MVDDLGETKVGYFGRVLVGGEKDVFGLEVAVGDALRVDVLIGALVRGYMRERREGCVRPWRRRLGA